jgi:uncharacterized iron-regulated membrane protein
MRAITGPLQAPPAGAGHKAGRDGERGFAPPLAAPAMGADQAVAAASGVDGRLGGAGLVSLSLPTSGGKPAWRVQLQPAAGAAVTVKVDDKGGKAQVQDGATANGPGGDPIAGFMRRMHDGSALGPVWRWIIALAGVAPTILALSGAVIWLTRRKIAPQRD